MIDGQSIYRGRFAPSPTGPLHFGSLVAALASFLDARSRAGCWLLRIDDIDPQREAPGAASAIQEALLAFGLEWDGPVRLQSQRQGDYARAMAELERRGLAYPCACSRREISRIARPGPNGPVYPGTCRNGLPPGGEARTLRVRVDDAHVTFVDGLQGEQACELGGAVGDFVIRRADWRVAYHLAAALDDGAADISHVVRGYDLLWCTPPQLYLMELLGLTPPRYLHLPLAVNPAGQKLSKQTHAAPLDTNRPERQLHQALCFLRQRPPESLTRASVRESLDWAVAHWDLAPLAGLRESPVPAAIAG